MKEVSDYLKECVEDGAFPGAVWQIGNSRELLEIGSVGILGEGLGSTSETTIYDLASLTKIVVTYALMKQFEEGCIRLEDSISYFLPDYANSNKKCITLLELLTHTSTIPGQLQLYHHAHKKEDVFEAIRWQIPRADSPKVVDYTSKGFIVLGEIISAIDKKPLDEVLMNRVLKPLGMEAACFNPPKNLIHKIAPTEACFWRGRIVRGQVHDENAVIMGGVSGHAGLFAPIQDVSRIASIMLDGKTTEGSEFFKPLTINLMTSNYTKGKNENRGLGFMLAGPKSPAGDLMTSESFGHTGFTGTSIWIDPKLDLYAVLLSNRIHPNRNNNVIFRVRNIFHNLAVLKYS